MDICPHCESTGQKDKVWRGNTTPGNCDRCKGRGWVELEPDEKEIN